MLGNPIVKYAGKTDKNDKNANAAQSDKNIDQLRREVADLNARVDELTVMYDVRGPLQDRSGETPCHRDGFIAPHRGRKGRSRGKTFSGK
jgi:hypothetical protein